MQFATKSSYAVLKRKPNVFSQRAGWVVQGLCRTSWAVLRSSACDRLSYQMDGARGNIDTAAPVNELHYDEPKLCQRSMGLI